MLWLCRGHRPCRIDMSANHRYYPEHLVSKAENYLRINQQVSLEVGDEHFQLKTQEELRLAAAIVASYHNQYVCNVLDYEDLEWVSDLQDDTADPAGPN
jgi:hypothetical protein